MDKKLKHLDYIQQAINRLASNLFLLKGWTVTLIAALFALASKDAKPVYALIAYIPAFMFWLLDAYFLSQERRFRSLYDHVRVTEEHDIDFSMNTEPYKNEVRNGFWHAFWSTTLRLYYGALIATMVIVMILLKG
ncbi:hypothetical protein [Steroidobacter cummioxidans]|uniref:hypothetical protein n=1 Tax=Steroidobacter cummioxidans TaxID=1803913 RepID=UPI000E31CED5|nr:hypothetical protein [Steroidobacter cummioxidans]